MAKGSSSFSQFNQICEEIRSGDIKPVYLLDGEEYYFLDQLLEVLEQSVLEEATRGFNHQVFYGKESNVMDIVTAARRFPMMAERQLIVVKEAQHLAKAEQIVPYLEQPLHSTVLVWYHPGKKLAANRKPGTAFKNHTVFTANSLKESEVPDVVQTYLKELGYDIEPKSLHLLVEYSSASLSVIMKELEKVFANVPTGNKIRESHIEEFVGINKEYNVFALQTALAQKNKSKALEILNYLKNNINANPVVLISATLFSYFRKVAILQSLGSKSDKELMSLLGIPFYFINEYRNAARNYPALKLQEAIQFIHEMDLKAKGIKEHSGDEKQLLEEIVVKLLLL